MRATSTQFVYRGALGLLALLVGIVLSTPAAFAASQADIDAVYKNTIFYDPNSGVGCSIGVDQQVSATLEGFIDAYGQAAFSVGQAYGIPYEAILAQAILESGYGKSSLSSQHYNFFGLKAGSSWTGPVVSLQTEEERADGTRYTVTADFRSYPSPEAGFNGYAEFITGIPRYKKALDYPGDPYKYLEEIRKAGYATDLAYVSLTHSLVDKIMPYIAEKGLFPPSSEIAPSNTAPSESLASIGKCIGGGGDGAAVVQIARAELAKNISESSGVNCGDGIGKYWNGSDDDSQSGQCGKRWPWCAAFVSWIYLKAGQPLDYGGGYSSYEWLYPGVRNLQAAMKDRGHYFEVGEKEPQPGDIAFYIGAQTPDGGSTSHVNIVVAVNGDSMTTIGGNESNSVKETTRPIRYGAMSLVGFGRPQ